MLESFVSSRIRRTLLEYILAHPAGRFYLRGLSKELGLSVSPLRRELKRLERSGMIAAVAEGNMLFYSVNASSAAFLELNSFQATAPRPQHIESQPGIVQAPPAAVRLGNRQRPLLAAMAGSLLVIGIAYVTIAHQRLFAQHSRAPGVQKQQVTVVVPAASAAGAMRGERWRVVPGGFGGGFSSTNSNSESY